MTIDNANDAKVDVEVFDILGKQVISGTTENNRFNVSQLNPGMYLMKLTQNNASVTKKLIVK